MPGSAPRGPPTAAPMRGRRPERHPVQQSGARGSRDQPDLVALPSPGALAKRPRLLPVPHDDDAARSLACDDPNAPHVSQTASRAPGADSLVGRERSHVLKPPASSQSLTFCRPCQQYESMARRPATQTGVWGVHTNTGTRYWRAMDLLQR